VLVQGPQQRFGCRRKVHRWPIPNPLGEGGKFVDEKLAGIDHVVAPGHALRFFRGARTPPPDRVGLMSWLSPTFGLLWILKGVVVGKMRWASVRLQPSWNYGRHGESSTKAGPGLRRSAMKETQLRRWATRKPSLPSNAGHPAERVQHNPAFGINGTTPPPPASSTDKSGQSNQDL